MRECDLPTTEGNCGTSRPALEGDQRGTVRRRRQLSCCNWPGERARRRPLDRTGDQRAEIGQGFEPCTRTAAFYDFPREAPLLRFLDTRGLGEANYDALSDIAWCEGQSHLILAVMQVSDPVQQEVLSALREARQRHPDWPVVVAQTGLHRLYPASLGHPMPYPYTGAPEDETQTLLPHALRQALAYQRRLFDPLRGRQPRFVPIDLTMPEDGFPPT